MSRLCLALASAVFLAAAPNVLADGYKQTNLVSDIPGLAIATDPSLVNPWGLTSSPTSPFWVSNQGTSSSTLYNGAGTQQGLVVTLPPTGGPTGIVFNGTANFNSDVFLFATLGGTIDGWKGSDGTTATVEGNLAGGVFTGLASGSTVALGSMLYTADVTHAQIDVFDSSFHVVGSFRDTHAPAGYAPYNIQNIGGMLYVEYVPLNAMGRPVPGLGNGFVDVFNTDGTFVQRLITGGQLDDPWGITLAPTTFGQFGGDLLVGNFGNGEINAFNPTTGAFVGTLEDGSGNPLVNSGLWGLRFGNGGNGGDPNTLFFNAGINHESDGLFGSIQATPEPSTMLLLGSGLVGLLVRCKKTAEAAA